MLDTLPSVQTETLWAGILSGEKATETSTSSPERKKPFKTQRNAMVCFQMRFFYEKSWIFVLCSGTHVNRRGLFWTRHNSKSCGNNSRNKCIRMEPKQLYLQAGACVNYKFVFLYFMQFLVDLELFPRKAQAETAISNSGHEEETASAVLANSSFLSCLTHQKSKLWQNEPICETQRRKHFLKILYLTNIGSNDHLNPASRHIGNVIAQRLVVLIQAFVKVELLEAVKRMESAGKVKRHAFPWSEQDEVSCHGSKTDLLRPQRWALYRVCRDLCTLRALG